MRARDIFLALLLIAGGVFLTYAKSGRLNDWVFGWEGPWFGSFEKFAYEETREIPAPIPPEIQVFNAHGSVDVAAAPAGATGATVVFKERVSARNREEADRTADALRMVVTQSEARLVLATNRNEFRRRNFSTDFKILVPAGTAVLLKNSYGPVRVESMGPAEISNPHGGITVRGTEGPLTVTSSYETVHVDGVRGDVHISAPHSDIDVRNVAGALGLDHSYGRITLDTIGRKAVVKGSHSLVNARNLAEDAEIASTYDSISVTGAKGVLIRAEHCDVEAKNVDGLLDITDTYGRVRIGGLSGDLRVDGRNLGVTGTGLSSGTIFIRTSYQDVSLSGFSGPAELILSHAGLILEPSPSLSGTVNIQGEYADVRLAWPSGFKTPFEARTRNGRIAWKLADAPDSETSNGSVELRAFSSEAGKPAIKIDIRAGDIRVDPSGR